MPRFLVADTLTGALVGQLFPHEFELGDPWTGAGTGTLKVALPSDQVKVAQLVELTRPKRRWLWVTDDDGRHLWCGPVSARPGRSGGEVIVPLVDWRAWFYAAFLRPNLTTEARGDYIVTNTEQATIARTLALKALSATGAPAMVVDGLPDTGVKRDRTLLQLDRSVGDMLDGLSAQKTQNGLEWWVYAAVDPASPTRLVPHVAFAHPERRLRAVPLRLEWRLGQGGNISEPSWPTGQIAPSRVWAVGEGDPPDQPWAVDTDADVDDGLAVLWESLIGPLDGVKRSERCFEYATAALDYYAGQSGQFSCDVVDARVPLGDYSTGDRVRLTYDDGWDAVDLEAVRITDRVITGGRDKPLAARVTLDLANDGYGDTGAEPGEVVTDDGS